MTARISTLLAVLAIAAAAQAQGWIGSPDATPTLIDRSGAVLTEWGPVGLSLSGSEGAPSLEWSAVGFPSATATSRASELTLTTRAYRAQLWPGGIDVLEATLTNTASQARDTEMVLHTPDAFGWGEGAGIAGGRVALRLPEGLTPIRKQRDWGCATPAQAMPGWARPNLECDPAFRNIRAGMGGVPIRYGLRVQPGSSHRVVLGFCESHWAFPGQRPVACLVEGAPSDIVDPVAEWGQHVPGCLTFDARDRDGDGELQVAVLPVPGSPDLNPILNAIWLFAKDTSPSTRDLIRGIGKEQAEVFVDVGGPGDRDLYEPGDLRFPLRLGPGEVRTARFLIAAAGQSVPAAESSPLPEAELLDAARAPWADWLAGARRALVDNPETASALATLAVLTAQSDDYYLVVPEFSAPATACSGRLLAASAWGLDEAGLHGAAERLLRILWDTPVSPGLEPAVAGLSTSPEDRALGLYALARRATRTRDRGWASRVWPHMAEAAQRLALEPIAGTPLASSALAEVAVAAAIAGQPVPECCAGAARGAPPVPALTGMAGVAASRLLAAGGVE